MLRKLFFFKYITQRKNECVARHAEKFVVRQELSQRFEIKQLFLHHVAAIR
jgi:hypothetical protein